jgi:outer membrane murein-binding lipoprotein Lpp
MSEDYKKIESRVETVEEAVQILKHLALRADERMDDFDASHNNLTVKVEALADAQIRIEETLSAKVEVLAEKIEVLADAQIRIEETLSAKVEALADSQMRIEERLSSKVEALASAQIRTEKSLKQLTGAQVHMAEAQAHTNQRLDALIDIVREGRNGK